MGQADVVVAVGHGQGVGQALCPLAQGRDALADRRPRRPDGEVETCHACRLERPAPGGQPLLYSASNVPTTTR